MSFIIDGTTPATAIIWAHALSADVKWRGCVHGALFDRAGTVIGSYHPYVTGSGYAIHTQHYGGYAKPEEIEIAPCTCEEGY